MSTTVNTHKQDREHDQGGDHLLHVIELNRCQCDDAEPQPPSHVCFRNRPEGSYGYPYLTLTDSSFGVLISSKGSSVPGDSPMLWSGRNSIPLGAATSKSLSWAGR